MNEQVSAQNTRNPVLDSLVNLVVGTSVEQAWSLEAIEKAHEMLLRLAEKEPGGVQRWNQ